MSTDDSGARLLGADLIYTVGKDDRLDDTPRLATMKLDPLPRFFPLDRAKALSDAVFAVVMTLLVLGIEVPQEGMLSGPEFVSVREKLGHQVLVYFVSFWIVAMYWSQHSLLLASLKRMDRAILVLNLTFLLPVTLLPFVTQLMGTSRGDWEVVAVFALTNLFAAFVFQRLLKHVVAQPEIHKGPETAALARRIAFGLRFFVAVVVVGVLTALTNVGLGILCFVLTPLAHFYNYVRDPLRSHEETTSADDASVD